MACPDYLFPLAVCACSWTLQATSNIPRLQTLSGLRKNPPQTPAGWDLLSRMPLKQASALTAENEGTERYWKQAFQESVISPNRLKPRRLVGVQPRAGTSPERLPTAVNGFRGPACRRKRNRRGCLSNRLEGLHRVMYLQASICPIRPEGFAHNYEWVHVLGVTLHLMLAEAFGEGWARVCVLLDAACLAVYPALQKKDFVRLHQ